jgi:hypothetical protein
MNRRFAFLGGLVGVFAIWRWFRRGPEGQRDTAAQTPDPADALRAKLEESRAVVDEREAFEEGETTVDAAPDPESRRRAVHDEARARLEKLSGTDEG